MPVHKSISNPSRIQVWADSRGPTSDRDVVFETAATLKVLIQADLDFRQKRSQLPKGDPDRTTDPNRPDLFWSGRYLVGRGIIVKDVEWDIKHSMFTVKLQKINGTNA